MNFLIKLLALLFGFAVVGLIGLSVIGILFAIIAPSAARQHATPASVPRPSVVTHMESESTVERVPGDIATRENVVNRRPGVSVTVQPTQDAVGVLAVMFFALPLLVIICFFFLALAALRLVVGRVRGPNSASSAEETRTIQEIHRGLARFEQRIQSLETILLDGAGYHTGVKD